jgi:hypothetical protein
LGHLDFDIVSNFDIRISDFSLPHNSLPNMMIQPAQLCDYPLPAGLFMATQPQFTANRWNAQKSTSTRFLSMSLGNPADCFMQNKPNLPDPQTNVTSFITINYEQITMNNANKNKPNQTQSPQSQNQPNSLRPKGLPKKPAHLGSGKTNPIKPNFHLVGWASAHPDCLSHLFGILADAPHPHHQPRLSRGLCTHLTADFRIPCFGFAWDFYMLPAGITYFHIPTSKRPIASQATHFTRRYLQNTIASLNSFVLLKLWFSYGKRKDNSV